MSGFEQGVAEAFREGLWPESAKRGSPGVMYLIRAANNQRYKIGVSHGELSWRIRELQKASPLRLIVVMVWRLNKPKATEQKLHKLMEKWRLWNEWFEIPERYVEILLQGIHLLSRITPEPVQKAIENARETKKPLIDLAGTITPGIVLERRREMKLSASDFSRRMGYVRSYVSAIENGTLPITEKFAEKFWAVLERYESGRSARKMDALVPEKDYVEGGTVHILRELRYCLCGCGQMFVPTTWNHQWMPGHRKRRKKRISH